MSALIDKEISNNLKEFTLDEKKHKFEDDIKDVYDTLALVNCSKAKWYTDAYLEDDVKDLLQSYEKEVAPLPDDDPVKIEMLHILAYLGIEIAKTAKPEKDEEPDDSELIAEG
jgi:hypothetical protein